MYTTKTTRQDMELARRIVFPMVRDTDTIPICFSVNGQLWHGISAEFAPMVETRFLDSRIIERIVLGTVPGTSLEIRAVCREYQDYPVAEWTAYLRNRGSADSPIVEDLCAMDGFLPGKHPIITASNGDTCEESLYMETHVDLEQVKNYGQEPEGGRASDSAWPYSRVMCEDYGYVLSIGWPGQWESRYAIQDGGFRFRAKQQDTRFFLRPGETVRTPRMTVMLHTGGEERSINLWRHWMLDHVVPRPYGSVVKPVVSISDGWLEHAESSEGQQTASIERFHKRGIRAENWWIDAGWYTCKRRPNRKNTWDRTGILEADSERYPRGLRPVADKAAENGLKLLVWFEPERIALEFVESHLYPEDYVLRLKDTSALDTMKRVGFGKGLVENVGLLNLGRQECCDWLIETIDKKIKEFGIGVYRQDFNFPPLLWWRQNDEENRRGMLENLYIQGYLRFWDELRLRNSGLWINSVSSGGRRSDLETLSRSASLHESDFAHGNHPILQAILANAFMWQPYCGSFATSWDNEDGEYLSWYGALPHNRFDNYMAHCAMAPAVLVFAETLGLDNCQDGDDAAIQSYQVFRRLWEKTALIMLRGDFYLLALSDRTNRSYHAIQFHDEDTGSGFVQVIRNAKCPEEEIILHPRQMDPEARYAFESPEFGKTLELDGAELLETGFSVSLSRRSGEIWFYRKL